MSSHPRRLRPAFSLLELAISLALITVLLAVLLPALASARSATARDTCSENLRHFGQAWALYLEDSGGEFPFVAVQPGWHYAGVRFSAIDDRPFLDPRRPLTPYMVSGPRGAPAPSICRCPGDSGITGETEGVGTGRRTAYRSFGTSYRANAELFSAARSLSRDGGPPAPAARRGLRLDEITTAPSRLVVMGDPVWYEVHNRTGRDAAWHGGSRDGNLLFLDGSVKFMTIFAPPRVGPAVFEPRLRGTVVE